MHDAATVRRFESYIHTCPNTGCWLWGGGLEPTGYGVFRAGSKQNAHRVAWEIYRGPIPPGKMVCHHCDVRWCANPAHLFVGMARDNVRDMHAKGRGHIPHTWGEDHGPAKLSNTDVLDILANPSGMTRDEQAARYGVCFQQIGKIVRREAWKHLGVPHGA